MGLVLVGLGEAERCLPGLLLGPVARRAGGNAGVVGMVKADAYGIGVRRVLLGRRLRGAEIDDDDARKAVALAEVGNSGSSLAPHLHMQVMDAPDPRRAATIGFLVAEYERWTGRQWQPARYRELVKGERVRFQSDGL